MSRMFPKLFTPGKIGTLELENRIIKAPTILFLASPDGSVTDRIIRFYEEVARGGTGLVIVEAAGVENTRISKLLPCQLGAFHTMHLPGLSSMAQAIQDNGSKAGLQLVHHGRRKLSGQGAAADASWETDYLQSGTMSIPAELSAEDIGEIVSAFGNGAKLARDAGFDMVEVHGAHGALITNFLSPATNQRTDRYGGSLENRMRLLVEIVGDVQAKAGADFPLSVRLSGTDYEPGGVVIEESVATARVLEKLGVHLVHVSGGGHHQVAHLTSPMSIPRGHNVWAAEAVKKAVSVPVVASGSITTPRYAEEILASGKADFISLGRPLFADPYWPLKARRDTPEDIRTCIRCNDGCQDRTNLHLKAIQCTVNVLLGKEDRLAITPAPRPRKVAVVGGGPGGMEAARVCALRGHDVTLYEKDRLGGALIPASVPEFKADIKELIRYLSHQMEKLKVRIVREEASAAKLRRGDFDAVILATGAVPSRLNIPGTDQPRVCSALDVLEGKAPVGQKVHIVGGGMIGVEVGLFLAEQGREVVFTTRQADFMADVGSFDRTVYTERFAKQRVTVLAGRRLEKITEKTSVVVSADGKSEEIAADTVVLSSGFSPLTALKEALENEPGLEVYSVGDCVSPRRIFDAVHEGHLAAKKI
ncbi:MAG: FAD-dependent oxidoreductase [Chloroflexota bacterium]